jgi:hypothetical protein
MRTKTLLVTAAIGAASLATSMAQVYSVNMVGYINLNLPNRFVLISCQLDDGAGNNLDSVLKLNPAAGPSTLFKASSGGLLDQYDYDPDTQAWTKTGSFDTTPTLRPGEGAYLSVSTPVTHTFVGEVETGTSSTVIFPSRHQIISSQIPQQGLVTTDLGFPIANIAETFFVQPWLDTVPSYNLVQYDTDGDTLEWIPSQPTLHVGESMWAFTSSATRNWTRTFPVGPP